jgi:hypothetical protein
LFSLLLFSVVLLLPVRFLAARIARPACQAWPPAAEPASLHNSVVSGRRIPASRRPLMIVGRILTSEGERSSHDHQEICGNQPLAA